jgi:signal transduction histidine kinase
VSFFAACAEHLLSLVSDILDFERVESNKLQLENIPFSVAAEAQKAVRLLQLTAGTGALLHHPCPHSATSA